MNPAPATTCGLLLLGNNIDALVGWCVATHRSCTRVAMRATLAASREGPKVSPVEETSPLMAGPNAFVNSRYLRMCGEEGMGAHEHNHAEWQWTGLGYLSASRQKVRSLFWWRRRSQFLLAAPLTAFYTTHWHMII